MFLPCRPSLTSSDAVTDASDYRGMISRSFGCRMRGSLVSIGERRRLDPPWLRVCDSKSTLLSNELRHGPREGRGRSRCPRAPLHAPPVCSATADDVDRAWHGRRHKRSAQRRRPLRGSRGSTTQLGHTVGPWESTPLHTRPVRLAMHRLKQPSTGQLFCGVASSHGAGTGTLASMGGSTTRPTLKYFSCLS